MPKMKTDRGAAKRIKVDGVGAAAPAQGLPRAQLREEDERPDAAPGPEADSAPGDERNVRRMLGL